MIRKAHILALWSLVAASVLLMSSEVRSASTNTLAWYESFENQADSWVVDGSNHLYTGSDAGTQALVNLSDPGAYDGTNVLYIPDGANFSNLIDNSSSVIWADFFAKVRTRDEAPEVDSSASSQFYFDTNFYAVVQDGPSTNWRTLTNNLSGSSATQIDTSEWTRITVVHNYTDKKWALIVNDEVLDDNIGFINTSISQMSKIIVSNECSLDSILIDTNAPDAGVLSSNTILVGDADSDGMGDAWEIGYFDYVTSENSGDDYDQDGQSSVTEYDRGTDPTDADDVLLKLSYRDDFESASVASLSGTWRGIGIAGTADLQSSDAIEGSKALKIGEGQAVVPINDNTGTNVWVQVYSKPNLFADFPSDLPDDQVAGWCVTTNGEILAYDASAWITCNQFTVSETNIWLGFAAHLDYEGSTYDLYVSTNESFGAHMKRAHDSALGFNSSASSTNITEFTVTNGTDDVRAYVDVIAASYAYTNAGVSAMTNLVAYDRIAGQYNNAVLPPYNYTGDDDLLSGKVGDDFKRGLADGDKIHIYTGIYNIYFLDSSSDWQKEAGADIASFELTNSMSIKVQRFAGDDVVVFYPYSNAVAIASQSISPGWTSLGYSGSPVLIPATHYSFTGQDAGDRIVTPNGWMYWNGTKWKQGASDATMTINQNDTIWYLSSGDGASWNIGD